MSVTRHSLLIHLLPCSLSGSNRQRARGRIAPSACRTRAVRPSLLQRTPRTAVLRVLGAPPPGLVRLPCRPIRGLPPPPRGGCAPTRCGRCLAIPSCGVCIWGALRPGWACRPCCPAGPTPSRRARACAPTRRRRWPSSATCRRLGLEAPLTSPSSDGIRLRPFGEQPRHELAVAGAQP